MSEHDEVRGIIPANQIHFEAGFTPEGEQALYDRTEAETLALAGQLLERTTGLDISSPHGEQTPKRFVAMLRELTTPKEFKFTTFDNVDQTNDMVVIQHIPFHSLCNHHVVPFVGEAAVGYVPGPRLAGLSKFARVVQYYAHGLQVQERLTQQVAERIQQELEPLGVAVVLKAEHMCMTLRGVQAPGTLTTTSSMLGVFGMHDRTAKAEFLSMLNGRSS